MNIYLICLIIFIIGIYIGIKIANVVNAIHLKAILNDFNITDKQVSDMIARYEKASKPQSVEPESVTIVVEQHDNMLYAYNKTTNTFIAQASTFDDLVTVLNKDYNNIQDVTHTEVKQPLQDPV